MKISVSYLSSKFDKKTTLKKIVESKADYLHVDLMDGKIWFESEYEVGTTFYVEIKQKIINSCWTFFHQ